MTEDKKYSQITVRFLIPTEKKIVRVAEKQGMKKATWLRKVALEALDKSDL